MTQASSAIPPNNTGSSTGPARQEFWVRENRMDTALDGPFEFNTADTVARFLSNREDKSGLAQVVTLLGSRPGDPIKNPVEIKVVFMYIRGRRALGGRTAQFHSDRDLPPTV